MQMTAPAVTQPAMILGVISGGGGGGGISAASGSRAPDREVPHARATSLGGGESAAKALKNGANDAVSGVGTHAAAVMHAESRCTRINAGLLEAGCTAQYERGGGGRMSLATSDARVEGKRGVR